MTERLHFHFSLSCIGEGNGNPLQCSCLENPRDRGARWAAMYGVAQSRTRLKWLISSSTTGKPSLSVYLALFWIPSYVNLSQFEIFFPSIKQVIPRLREIVACLWSHDWWLQQTPQPRCLRLRCPVHPATPACYLNSQNYPYHLFIAFYTFTFF